MDNTLEFHQSDDDFIDVYLGEHLMGVIDYDRYGRGGQHAAVELLRNFADAFSLDVIET